MSNTERILFIGNPGVGKSTFLNGLLGCKKFKSGISVGCGLTEKVQWVSSRRTGISYGDTPGLADIINQVNTALELEKALKVGGNYRIIFMVTEEAGRIRPSDVATMNLVGNCLQDCNFQYGIILNKLQPRLFELLLTDESSKRIILNCFNQIGTSKRNPTSLIWFHPEEKDLIGKNNAVPNLPDDLKNFIHKHIPITHIQSNLVRPIEINRYNDLMNQYEAKLQEIKRLEETIAKLENDKIQLTVSQQKEVDEYRADFEKLKRDLEHQHYKKSKSGSGGSGLAGSIAKETVKTLAPIAVSMAISTVLFGVPLPII